MSERSSGPRMDVVFGRRPVIELLRAAKPAQKVLISERARPSSVLDEIRRIAADREVTVESAAASELDRLAEGGNHQGVAALAARYRYANMPTLLAGPAPSLLFLDGVMDPHNL